jgi:UDP-N-acetylglucosamine/UDP-N-acetylgalactosamine diphosphorylase
MTIRIKEKIKYIHIIGVDNVLAKLVDPLFLGFAEEEGMPISCKYVQKKNWQERVGVHVYKGGKPSIVGKSYKTYIRAF